MALAAELALVEGRGMSQDAAYRSTAWALQKDSKQWYELYCSVYDAIWGHFRPPFSDFYCLSAFSYDRKQYCTKL